MKADEIGNVFLRLGVEVLPAFTTGEESSVESRVAALKEAKDDIIEVHEADLATAQAQVAVMGGALETVLRLADRLHTSDNESDLALATKLHVLAHQALSAAPKVVWAGPIQVFMDEYGLPSLVPLDDMTPLEELRDREFEVIVLDKQGEGE